ncbi:hypothetical protein FOZ60_001090 [Perkinsus olseni]|uniref:subtilisin n=2 Tax=Perkinsus olseni TaxID=32597 RepID=A0A7J6P154_PEROL|nr:hypothetical protein FOZ60_001090 [Perkinsus olseni]
MFIAPTVLSIFLVDVIALQRETIVSIKSGNNDVDVRRLPQMLMDAGHIPDQNIASALRIAKVLTLEYVGFQVVQTSTLPIDSRGLCSFVTAASRKLSLQSMCTKDANGGLFGGRSTPEEKRTKKRLPYYDSELHVNDPDAPRQEYLFFMEMGKVWPLALKHGTREVKVAVIDSGIDWKDRDLGPLRRRLKKKSGGYIEGGWNVYDDSSHMTTGHDHGAAVCRVLAAKINNSFGLAGIAPNVALVPLQFVNDKYYAPLSKLIEAINMAIDLEVDFAAYATHICVGQDTDGNCIRESGSSFAAPMVAGIAAILLSIGCRADDGEENDGRLRGSRHFL